MTYQKPCSSPENDPNDWFISRDGKQYADDDLLTPTEVEKIQVEVDTLGLEGEAKVAAIDKAVGRAENEVKQAQLRRRRQARDKCHTECYFRTVCLGQALEEHQDHGTWGGYFEEQLREIRKEIARRKRRKPPTA